MPYTTLNLRPGVNTLATRTLNEQGWSASNLIRWLNGYLQKIGGWQAITSEPLIGTCRALHPWQDLDGNVYMAAGTNAQLAVIYQGGVYTITPITATVNLSNPLSTTNGLTTVNVNDVAHGAAAGDVINIGILTSIGGIILFGDYVITTIVDADNYEIEAADAATSTVVGGGDVPVFNTTNASPTVEVVFPDHGYSVGDIFPVQVSVSVGGFTIVGEYVVDNVVDADTFEITMSTNASSDDTATENGGNVRIYYYLQSGPVSNTPLVGYGSGTYGSGPYGIGTSSSSVISPARVWSLDNFGENLIASPVNGAIYEWIPPIDVGNFATVIATAPTINTAVLVVMPQAQVMALGSEVGSVQDPLLVRWCDNGDYTDWTATSVNSAGSYRLSRGSKIIGGIQAPQFTLIWTDIDLWSVQYTGYPFVYAFQVVQSGCGLIGQKARAVLSRNTYWMSEKGFFVFGDSGVAPLPCTVWDQVFADLDQSQTNKIIAAPNSLFNEVAWFYPSLSGGTGEVDSYVKYNSVTQTWDYGSLVRTAWTDQSIFGEPIGVDAESILQQHEVGDNADDAAMTGVQATSGYADISTGEAFAFIDQIIPDFYMTGPNPSVTMTVYATNWPNYPATEYGPYTITPSTQFITIRARARQIAVKVQSDSLGTFWRLGNVRVRTAPAGSV